MTIVSKTILLYKNNLYIYKMYRGREYNPPPPFFSEVPSPFNQIHYSTQVPSKHPAANAQMASLNSSEAKQRAAAAKAHALSEFKQHFLRANISRFQVQVDFDTNRKATAA